MARLIAAVRNLKHQTALSVAYGAGLRTSEVIALKSGDIDSERTTLRIEQGSNGSLCKALHKADEQTVAVETLTYRAIFWRFRVERRVMRDYPFGFDLRPHSLVQSPEPLVKTASEIAAPRRQDVSCAECSQCSSDSCIHAGMSRSPCSTRQTSMRSARSR